MRDLIAAWCRLLLAIYLIVALPSLILLFAGSFDPPIGIFLVLSVLASPVIFFRNGVVQPQAPYLRRGYWFVAAYVAAASLFMTWISGEFASPRLHETLTSLPFIVLAAEAGALYVVLVYVLLWRLSDRYLAPQPGRPRRLVRLAVALAFVLSLAFYAPQARRSFAADSCLDDGGRVASDGSCDLGPVGRP